MHALHWEFAQYCKGTGAAVISKFRYVSDSKGSM
jgi:hypothetical protein